MSHTQSYPGIQLGLRHHPQGRTRMYPIGAHYNCWGSESEMLPVREVFMMALMDFLTDKADWHKKISDPQIVAQWRAEELEQPEESLYLQVTGGKTSKRIPQPRARIMSEAAFDYCIEELRFKAAHFETTGLIHTLDSAGNIVIKSDTVVSLALQTDLRAAINRLRTDQALDVDLHSRSNEMVQDLIYPSMHPFIYGRSSFLEEEAVGVSNAVRLWAAKGKAAPKNEKDQRIEGYGVIYERRYSIVPPQYWSSKYQWLPSNLAFQQNETVKFTSYINNLHPTKYPEIYCTIESLVNKAISAWDQCLYESEYQHPRAGRPVSRFRKPRSCEESDWEPFNAEVLVRHEAGLREVQLDNEISDTDNESNPETETQEVKWRRVRDPILPEPEDDMTDIEYFCSVSLREKFKATGLQVIVKLATIELTPEKPEFPMGGWHIEGQMNERICATALYYLDSENVTPGHISFRMQTSDYLGDLQDLCGQDDYNWLERVYGTELGGGGLSACLQYYGSVETRQGRLLAFPNVFQHRVSSFKLQDPTKPGHRSFIALWLVDPHRRIVSTANVPPQQLDWWTEAVFGEGGQSMHSEMPPDVYRLIMEQQGPTGRFPKKDFTLARDIKLPTEILDMVRQKDILGGLMTAEEARQHRLELKHVRRRFHETCEAGWEGVKYDFSQDY